MSHQTKDCLERPRAKGAKWTNKNIAADEKVQDINITDFDAKRDRWNGYDAAEYSRVIDRHEQLENIRKEMKQKEQLEKLLSGKAADDLSSGDADDDEARIHDEEDAGRSSLCWQCQSC